MTPGKHGFFKEVHFIVKVDFALKLTASTKIQALKAYEAAAGTCSEPLFKNSSGKEH